MESPAHSVHANIPRQFFVKPGAEAEVKNAEDFPM